MYREFPSKLVAQIEKIPPMPHKEIEETLQNTEEWQVMSEAWLWIIYHPHLFANATSKENPSNLFNSPKAPSRHPLLNSPHNELLCLLLFNLTLLYPTLLQPTLHTLNSTSGISSKSEISLKPSLARNVPRHRDSPLGGAGWKKCTPTLKRCKQSNRKFVQLLMLFIFFYISGKKNIKGLKQISL